MFSSIEKVILEQKNQSVLKINKEFFIDKEWSIQNILNILEKSFNDLIDKDSNNKKYLNDYILDYHLISKDIHSKLPKIISIDP
jgi:hypothetical protein